MDYVIVTKSLGSIGDGDPNATTADLDLEGIGPGLVPIMVTVWPLTTGSPALGTATGLQLNCYGSSSSSAATVKGATSDITSAVVWKLDNCLARRMTAGWVGSPDGSSVVALEAEILCRVAAPRT